MKHSNYTISKKFLESKVVSDQVEEYANERIQFLKKRCYYFKMNWLWLRILILLLDFTTIILVFIAIFYSVEDYKDKIINWKTFWGSIGPTLFLCAFIITLFALNVFLIFFKKQARFTIYKKAISEIQQVIIHYNDGFSKMSLDEKQQKIQKIYEEAMSRRESTILGWSNNYLGED